VRYQLSLSGNNSNQRLGDIKIKLKTRAIIGITALKTLFLGSLIICHNFSEYRKDI